jgi:hypothetical protein
MESGSGEVEWWIHFRGDFLLSAVANLHARAPWQQEHSEFLTLDLGPARVLFAFAGIRFEP